MKNMNKTITAVVMAFAVGSVANAQISHSNDFTDGGTSFNSNFSQFGSGTLNGGDPWIVSSKVGYTNSASLTWNGSMATDAVGAAYYTGSSPDAFGSNSANGNVNWDLRTDGDGASTIGDTVGFSIMGNNSIGSASLFFGTRVLSTSAAGDTFELIVSSNGVTNALASFFVPDDVGGSGAPNYWSSLDFTYSINGGVATVNYNASGIRDDNGVAYLANPYSITGSTSINVDPSLLADNSAYLGFSGSSTAKVNTPNSGIDNISFTVNAAAVPEPSSALLIGLGSFIGLIRRKR